MLRFELLTVLTYFVNMKIVPRETKTCCTVTLKYCSSILSVFSTVFVGFLDLVEWQIICAFCMTVTAVRDKCLYEAMYMSL